MRHSASSRQSKRLGLQAERAGRLACVLASSAICLAGCLDAAPAADYGDPTNLGVATTQGGITVQVFAPSPSSVLIEPLARVELAAYTDPPSVLEVSVTTPEGFAYLASASGAPGAGQRFSVDVPLLHGENVLAVRVVEVEGLRSRRLQIAPTYHGEAPAVRFGLYDDRHGEPCGVRLDRGITAASAVCVKGRVSTAGAPIATVELGLDGASAAVAVDASGTFEGLVSLPTDAVGEVVVSVVDEARAEVAARRRVIQDSTPPTLSVLLADQSPTRTSEFRVRVEGTVADAHGVATLRLENDAGGVALLSPTPSFVREVNLVPGENAFELVAVDIAGNEARRAFVVIRDRLIRLGPPGSGGQAQLNLDRDALEALLTVEDQMETEIVAISLRAPVLRALYAIREPERFEVDTSAWGSPEWNLHDLLEMTPDTANLEGSSIEELLAIAPSVGLPSPRLLAELLALEPTDTFVDLEVAVNVVLEQLIGTHPSVGVDDAGEPVFHLSLHDILNDLAPLVGRFGPEGEHPGFLDGQISAEVFEPGFLMSIPARSNLAPHQGVDASRGGKDYLFLAEGDQLLVLDFLSPDFAVVGLVDEPTVDLRLSLGESDQFFEVATTRLAGADPVRPGFYRGDSGVWGTADWHMEKIVAEIAYRQFQPLFADGGYQRTLRYDAGAIVDAAVIDWNRGWVTITTSGGLGNPPAPTYVWDILTEVAQLRLHEGGVPEGGVDMAFLLERLPIGLDAAGLIDALTPTLQGQAAELADRLVSPEGLVESGVDFYFVPATDTGVGFLFFRAPGDAAGAYGYSNPGFFRDAALTDRSSTAASVPGTEDTAHEKVVPRVGDRHYFADDGGDVYALEIVTVDASGVELRVLPVTEVSP